MKKNLLFSAALLIGAASLQAATPTISPTDFPAVSMMKKAKTNVSRADDSMLFSFASPDLLINGLSLPVGNQVYVGTTILKSDNLSGNTITHLEFLMPTNQSYSNPVKKATIFISEGLGTQPVYTQEVTLSTTGTAAKTFKLDTPYVIPADKDVVVGWYFTMVNGLYFVYTDGDKSSAPGRTVINTAAAESDGTFKFPTSDWLEAGSQYGSYGLTMTLTGNNLPKDNARVLGASATYANNQVGEDAPVYLEVFNSASNPINTVKVRINSAGANDAVETVVNLEQPIKNFELQRVKAGGYKYNETALYHNIEAKVIEVNGKPVELPTYTVTTNVFEGGWPANLIIEEFTGTWCPWCPRGIVMLEYINNTYPDRYFCIAAHNGDQMALSAYDTVYSKLGLNGYPSAVSNRAYDMQLGMAYSPAEMKGLVDDVYNTCATNNAFGTVDMTINPVDDNYAEIAISADVEFALDMNSQNYISFVVIEDNVGPYNQKNNYAGGRYGEMDGWEKKGSSVKTVYNDVARAFQRYPGIANALPKTVEKGKKYHVDYTIKTGNLSSNDYAVIAILTDSKGNVINAAKVKSPNYGAISTVDTDTQDVNVSVSGGSISVNGADNFEVYTLDGRRCAANGLNAGLYIVRTEGRSFKVIVR